MEAGVVVLSALTRLAAKPFSKLVQYNPHILPTRPPNFLTLLPSKHKIGNCISRERIVTARSVLICGLLAVAVTQVSRSQDEKLPPPRRAGSDFAHVVTRFEFLGANSCSAASCHNGVKAEYATWVTKDPHSRAFDVLFNTTSVTISKNLGRVPAHEDALCLNCHVHPRFETAKHSDSFATDGVSCESCHGPAQHWIAEHFKPEWQMKSAKQKLELGMCDTRSLVGRTKLCVDCHVGSAAADVNHDLIAAGHPRLNFEFGGAHARMPHHWPDAKDKNPMFGGTPDFEARAWTIGQAVTAKAALELLAFRAGSRPRPPTDSANAKPQAGVWPEFAEYDCYRCHQPITSVAGQRNEPGRKVGALLWNRWYTSMTPQVVSKHLGEIRDAMEKSRPDRREIISKCNAAIAVLDTWLERPKLPEIIPAVERLKTLAKTSNLATWDEAGQLYLGLAAMHHAARDMNDASLPAGYRKLLETFNGALLFPPGQTSPKDFSPELLRDTLRKLQ